MTELWLAVLFGFGIWTLAYGFAKPSRFYEFPCIMAVTFTVFIFPQAISLIRFPGFASDTAVQHTLILAFACLVVCVIGYRHLPTQPKKQFPHYAIDEQKLAKIGLFYLAIAFIFTALISRMGADQTGGSQWSGKVTIYAFFASVSYIAVAILFRNAIVGGKPRDWVYFAISLLLPLQSAVLGGRRQNTTNLIVAIAMVLYFQKRWVPPRWAIAFVIIFATMVIPATGRYRSIARHQEWDRLEELDLVSNFQDYLEKSSTLELRNAAVAIDRTRATGSYGYGIGYWDEIIWRFVPAQLVGKGIKEFLLIERDQSETLKNRTSARYRSSVGSTVTGIGDSFTQLGIFGPLFFLVPAWVFANLWKRAIGEGEVFAQLLYIGTFTTAMRAITHQTVDFLPGLIYQLIFVGFAYWYTRNPVVSNRPNRYLVAPNTSRAL